jgi:PilZ domain
MPENCRLHYRQKLRSLAYLQLDSETAGIIRDVSQGGAAVQVLTPFDLNRRVRIGLDLPNPRVRFEAEGRVVWTDSLGQAGVEFLHLAPRSDRLLKEWLFTQLLTDAAVWARAERGELLFSSTSRTAIRFDHEKACAGRPGLVSRDRQPIGFSWFAVSSRRFSRIVDGIILTCAVLLFSLLTLLLTDAFPGWPMAIACLVGLAALFGLLYWFVFAVGFGITPGHRLAELAGSEAGEKSPKAESSRVRFR